MRKNPKPPRKMLICQPGLRYPVARWNVQYYLYQVNSQGHWALLPQMYLAMDTWTYKEAQHFANEFNHKYCQLDGVSTLSADGLSPHGITEARVVEVRYED